VPLKELTIPALSKLVHDYERIYVCSSNWHPQKRLKSNVELYMHLREKRPNSALIIMGKDPDVRVADPHVFYTGPVGPDVYMQVYAAASWMLHLAWADHCPNVVVEALSQGTPVACASVGGTKELIGSYGHVLQEQPYDYTLEDYDNPPMIDVRQVEDLPDRRDLDYTSIADIDIKNVTRRYIELFESVLA
jgi:glycosyltransferase involved in cell wall biosynthesis